MSKLPDKICRRLKGFQSRFDKEKVKMNSHAARYGLALCIILLSVFVITANGQYTDSTKTAQAPQQTEAERKALQKIQAATDNEARLQAASEYISKFPKGTQRTQAAGFVADKIAEVQDASQRIPLAEKYLSIFSEPAEQEFVNPILRDAYLRANRPDDAFRLGAKWLEKHPEDVSALTQMAWTGVEQAKRNNPKFVPESEKYALKAIELIEADKRPEQIDALAWGQFKSSWLPVLYQSVGIFAMVRGKPAEALARFQKAISINPKDPANYLLIASVKHDEYIQMAQQYKSMPAGPAQDQLLEKINTKLDEVIQLYAQVVALSSLDPVHKTMHDQVLTDLQSYYKYRHNNSTEGLQQLIDKYKKGATP